MESHILASIQQALVSKSQQKGMVDPVEVQCSLSCNLLNLFHALRDCCSCSSHPLPLKRLAQELSFEADNKRLKESDPEATEREKSKFRVEDEKALWKMRKRPSKLFIPEPCTAAGFAGDRIEESILTTGEEYLEVKGRGYSLACRKGHKSVMEDGYGAISNINGCSKQAFFGVFDGHGGRAAVDFVSEKLGENIISALGALEREENQLDLATKAGYSATDGEFIRLGARSGACAATVLLKDGELSAANVGDCRVVLSRRGAAEALTVDHSAGRDDERRRIEDSGGYVTCWNGVWRVQDSLAVSRSIGDSDMKEWIISEPETRNVALTWDCEFLVLASDGLWGKVGNQEAVDVVQKQNDSIRACKELIDLSQRRGCKDDITVMVVNLRDFVQ